jgi:phosphoglycolate phosphatase-like HAD superfamily hydrolase
MKLVLFDIDGTLLWTDGAGRRAIHRALLEETGTAGPIETYRFDGKTDPQIVRELLALAGHPEATPCAAATSGYSRPSSRSRPRPLGSWSASSSCSSPSSRTSEPAAPSWAS